MTARGLMPLSLRTRVMVSFGLVLVLVTGLLAVITWQLSTRYMIGQRERSAVRQATVNARLVESVIVRDDRGLPELLTGLGSEFESAVLLVDHGRWISSGNVVDPKGLPDEFLTMVAGGQAARQRLVLNGTPVMAVGIPLPGVAATYVEVSPLRELDRTFHFLSWTLLAGVAASAFAGALLGRWAARRALRPLTQLTQAAGTAAAGDLDVRLPVSGDPDLAPLATAFNETTRRLAGRVRRDARFAGDVSHELRSPLTTMINAMAVLRRRRAEFSGPAGQAVDLLGADLDRFKAMVDDLLEISLADQGAQNLDLQRTDLGELVHRAAGHAGVTVPVERTSPSAFVHADRRKLERVVANLIGNADQHGGGLVRLAVVAAGTAARIEVDDDGPGVPADDRERIFERFHRGASHGSSDTGVGLGLALVSEHVRAHRGTVWVEDRPSGGARFVVELPLDAG